MAAALAATVASAYPIGGVPLAGDAQAIDKWFDGTPLSKDMKEPFRQFVMAVKALQAGQKEKARSGIPIHPLAKDGHAHALLGSV